MKVSKPSERASSKSRRRRLVESVLIGLGVVVLLDAFFGERGLVEMIGGLEKYEAVERSLDAIRQENERMRDEISLLNDDPGTIENEARKLGLIKPGEKVIIIHDQPETSDPQP